MNDQQNTILRFALIFLMLVVAFIAVLVKILVVQYRPSEREKWAVAEEIQDENTVTIEPVRGNIFDCNGQLLASSIPQYLLYMDPLVDAFRNEPDTFRHGKNKGKPYGPDTLYYNNIDTLCAVLSNVLKWKTKEEYRQYIDAARNAVCQDQQAAVRGHGEQECEQERSDLGRLEAPYSSVRQSGIAYIRDERKDGG